MKSSKTFSEARQALMGIALFSENENPIKKELMKKCILFWRKIKVINLIYWTQNQMQG